MKYILFHSIYGTRRIVYTLSEVKELELRGFELCSTIELELDINFFIY